MFAEVPAEEIELYVKKTSRVFGTKYNSHYGNSMDPSEMTEWAKNAAKNFKKHLKKNPKSFYILCYRGMSGISAATHLCIELEKAKLSSYAKIYVRKKEEKSHGADCEQFNLMNYNPDFHQAVFVFVDDFIDSGRTMREVFESVQEYYSVQVDTKHALMALNTYEDGELRKLSDRFVDTCKSIEEHFIKQVKPNLESRAETYYKRLQLDHQSDNADTITFTFRNICKL